MGRFLRTKNEPFAASKRGYTMPASCSYGMCPRVGSPTFQGYCNEDHMKRGLQLEFIQNNYAMLKDIFPMLVKLFGGPASPKT